MKMLCIRLADAEYAAILAAALAAAQPNVSRYLVCLFQGAVPKFPHYPRRYRRRPGLSPASELPRSATP